MLIALSRNLSALQQEDVSFDYFTFWPLDIVLIHLAVHSNWQSKSYEGFHPAVTDLALATHLDQVRKKFLDHIRDLADDFSLFEEPEQLLSST